MNRVARIGRFAPSPTGPLHAGSLAAAVASWLDVRAHGGKWLVRIEDIDSARERPGAADAILATLAAFGFRWDEPVARQSARHALYLQAFDRLREAGAIYPCGCTRREIEEAVEAHGPAVYPGTCRPGLPDGIPGELPAARPARAWRMRTRDEEIVVDDRAIGVVGQNVGREVGDFVVRRADGLWAYQLAVVVDDGDQGVTDVVRGIDLLDSTPRQRLLQEALGLPFPRTLHIAIVVDETGRKLSKSRDASALDDRDPLTALNAAARHLGLGMAACRDLQRFWELATAAWAVRHPA